MIQRFVPVMTQKEVGDRMGISLQRVQQIEKSALNKLRKRLAHFAPGVESEAAANERETS